MLQVRRGFSRNVHTFSALMNVAIKAGQNQLAVDFYKEMQEEGCKPNLVTYVGDGGGCCVPAARSSQQLCHHGPSSCVEAAEMVQHRACLRCKGCCSVSCWTQMSWLSLWLAYALCFSEFVCWHTFAAHIQNTLIDAYGKLGLWVEAMQVLPLMRSKVRQLGSV
jgi:pentatricopeptide repeat protein